MAVVNDDEEWKKDIAERNQTRSFLRGKEMETHLDETYKATRAAMIDIGLAKAR